MPEHRIIGLEILSKSSEYDWISETGRHFEKVTLSKLGEKGTWPTWRIIAAILRHRAEAVFFCHYERTEIYLAAILTRLFGIRAFTMNDSKFDDYGRNLWREVGKSFFFLPYNGALAASRRSADYVRFLGLPAERIALGYDAISIERIRKLAKAPPAPDGVVHADRHFTIVARLLPKKNISLALKAFATFVRAGGERQLVICGSGPLEAELKALAAELGVESAVEFTGFVQTEEICQLLASTLALILPSTEEQFGQVIPEALAMGVPVLASDNCGARDHLVETAVNGYVFEPHNVEGLTALMRRIDRDQDHWRALATAANRIAPRGDVAGFVAGVRQLMAIQTQP